MSTRRYLWRGLTTVSASLLAIAVAATPIVESSRTDIDKFLGTKSSKIITDENEDKSKIYTYKSDYSSTDELLKSIADLGERMSEEGSVLLKNNNSALPLKSDELQKISLLGYSSYYPVQGGDMGSTLAENKGTSADTVDFLGALAAKGFKINPTLEKVYTALKEEIKGESVMPWGQTFSYYHAVAPAIGGKFSNPEPTLERLTQEDSSWEASLDEYNTMIVTIGRGAAENANYTPGEEGVNAGSGQDDPLGLSDSERAVIKAAEEAKKSNGGKVIVLLNNASAMEIEELKNDDGVDAILEIGLPGGYGFYGVCDVLSGAENPSGRLSDTYAVKNAASPAAQNYGDYEYTNADSSYAINSAIVEAEGIYDGYKYYETRYADLMQGKGNADSTKGSSTGKSWNYDDEVTYPFGYGLSYTSFEQKLKDVKVDLENKSVTATVDVTNTGDVAGKDAVELYVSVPYTDYDVQHSVEKSAIQLLDYAKTGLLKPGESETVTITADAQYMASYDSSIANADGTEGAYILDDGEYIFTVGDDAHDAVNNVLKSVKTGDEETLDEEPEEAVNAISWKLDKFDSTTFAKSKNGTAVSNQLADMDVNYYMPGTVKYLTRSDWDASWPKTYDNLTANTEMLDIMQNGTYQIAENGDTSEVKFGEKNGLTLAELKGNTDINDEKYSELMDQLSLEEAMIRTAFGGTSTKTIESILSPEAIQNDGPNGFGSYTLGQYANTDASSGDPYVVDKDDPNLNYKFGTMCNETVIGQTFNKELAREYGEMCGNYSIWANTTILWGAGANLHRVPYNARNHEYYSEDPILTGYQAAAFVEGGNEYGCIIALKHFAFNDTEINRTGLSVFMTEQKAREGELRAMQPAVEDAGELGVMTAYNRVGVTADNAHYGLMMNILRGEWGFKGLMSEDFIQDPFYASLKDAVHCGVTMTCNTGDNKMDAVASKWNYWTKENVEKDAVLMSDLKRVMLYQNYALANSNAMDGLGVTSKIVSVNTWYDNALLAAKILMALLTILFALMYIRSSKEEVVVVSEYGEEAFS